ncbi:MAG: hypothetical protein HPY73_08065 [Methanomassiliicoccales archaeon]|nr:MAG: hypothetical protein HPY73_08065 [Methanomassiliicoccales archaeon]
MKDEFELTEWGVNAIILTVITGAVLAILSQFNSDGDPSGERVASIIQIAMLIIGLITIYAQVSNECNPLIGFYMIFFGGVFEFGSVTDMASILPYAILIDVVWSVLYPALAPLFDLVGELLSYIIPSSK